MSLNVFGVQPLLPLATDFRRSGADLEALAVSIDDLAETLATNEVDVRALRDDIAVLDGRVAALDTVSALQAAPAGVVLLLAVAWFAVQAAAFAAAGGLLLRGSAAR
jgi:hypothetical protein